MARRITLAILLMTGNVIADDTLRPSWLLGCWASLVPGSSVIESWELVDDEMHGISMAGADVLERLHIGTDESGALVLTASPKGQATARFKLIGVSDEEVVFANPDHDFPQRIIYRLVGDDRMLGRIEGKIDDEERVVEFPMKKIECV